MRALYATVLNRFPLVIPALIFCAVAVVLVPVLGPYGVVIALVAAAKLTEYW